MGASNSDRNADGNINETPFPLIRVTTVWKFDNSKCWQGCGGMGTLVHCL